MMHSTYDVHRILDWVASRPANEHFKLDTVYNQLAPISFSLVDYILDREVERGSIYKSGPTGKYYMRRDSKMMSDTEKRLSDLEVKYKWLEGVVAKAPKKPRLWTPWLNSRVSEVPRGVMVDVMLAKGEVVPLFPSNEMFWCDNLPDEDKIVAWRVADKNGGYGWSCPIGMKDCARNCGDYGCGN